MNRIALSLALIIACTSDEQGTSSSSQTPETQTTSTETNTTTTGATTTTGTTTTTTGTTTTTTTTGTPPVVTIFEFTVTTTFGIPLDGVEMCSDLGCWPITNGMGFVEILADSDTRLVVDGNGLGTAVFEFHSDLGDMFAPGLIVGTNDENDFVASLFGETMDPNTATVAQLVLHPTGVVPDLGGVGRGPYIMDINGTPLPNATSIPPGGGLYLFFGVPPGTGTVNLPGCNEGGSYWGPTNDQAISYEVAAGESLGLFTVYCQ